MLPGESGGKGQLGHAAGAMVGTEGVEQGRRDIGSVGKVHVEYLPEPGEGSAGRCIPLISPGSFPFDKD